MSVGQMTQPRTDIWSTAEGLFCFTSLFQKSVDQMSVGQTVFDEMTWNGISLAEVAALKVGSYTDGTLISGRATLS
jgi:hypothetical protein